MASISSVPNTLLSGHTVPSNLASYLPQSKTPWQVSPFLFERLHKQNNDPATRSSKSFVATVVTPSDPEYRFVMSYFFSTKPSGYSIKSIHYIYNPTQIGAFEMGFPTIELGAKSFPPSWRSEPLPELRGQMIQRWENQTAQFSPIQLKSGTYPSVKMLPLWHGTAHIESICEGGFTYFGKHDLLRPSSAKAGISKSTDAGFFGSGIYFTNSAAYASMYGSSKLLLAWVAMRQPFPVISDCPVPNEGSDMRMLQGLGAYSTYNAHYIPVTSINPSDPGNMIYHPCYRTEVPSWDELVVFQSSQTLAQFVVELVVDFPITPSASASFTREQAIDLLERSKGGDKKAFDDLTSYVRLSNPIAQNALGWLYKQGEIVAKDFTEAARLFRLAAGQGYAPAQYNLGMACKNGEGVMRDFIEAVKWLRLASEQRFPGAQAELNQVLPLLSPVQLDERKDNLSSSSSSSSSSVTTSAFTFSLSDLQREFPNFRIFDEGVWEHYLGIRIDPRELPPLTTADIVEIRNHLLTMYPMVDGNAGVTLLTIPIGLTLDKLNQLFNAPKRGHKIPVSCGCLCDGAFTVSVKKSHRVLITNSHVTRFYSGATKAGRACREMKDHLSTIKMKYKLPRVIHIVALFYLTRLCHHTAMDNFAGLGLYKEGPIFSKDKYGYRSDAYGWPVLVTFYERNISLRPPYYKKYYAYGNYDWNCQYGSKCHVGVIKKLGSDGEGCVIS